MMSGDSSTNSFARVLMRPTSPLAQPTQSKTVLAAAQRLGLQLHVLNASSPGDFDLAFAKLHELQRYWSVRHPRSQGSQGRYSEHPDRFRHHRRSGTDWPGREPGRPLSDQVGR
jgi:hypothetical protein